MSKSTVSVVIPTYGRARLVHQTVLAALAQTRPAEEVVVSDDASPDDTVPQLSGLLSAHPALRIVRQPKNLGCNRNVNAVIEDSTGDLIAFCADDDLFLPWHLARAVDHLERNPEVGVVHAWFNTLETLPDGGTKVAMYPVPSRPASIHGSSALIYLIRNYSWPFHSSTLVFRRSLWREVGPFDPAFELADTDWFLRCAAATRVDFLPEVHLLNRRHAGNLSNVMGSVAMHSEVNQIALRFIERTEGLSRIERQSLHLAWRSNQLFRATRLAVARGRAGQRETAGAAAHMALAAVPFGSHLLGSDIEPAIDKFVAALHGLQAYLPGGQEKYAGLGLSQPK